MFACLIASSFPFLQTQHRSKSALYALKRLPDDDEDEAYLNDDDDDGLCAYVHECSLTHVSLLVDPPPILAGLQQYGDADAVSTTSMMTHDRDDPMGFVDKENVHVDDDPAGSMLHLLHLF